MTEFVALRPKLYAYRILDDAKRWAKRCKGIKRCVVEKSLSMEDYKKCLNYGENAYRSQMLITTMNVTCSVIRNMLT